MERVIKSDESLAKFAELLSAYTDTKGISAEALLNVAYDLFVVLQSLSDRHSRLRADLTKLLNKEK